MFGCDLSFFILRKAFSDMPALELFWGKPNVQFYAEGGGTIRVCLHCTRSNAPLPKVMHTTFKLDKRLCV